MDEEGRLAVWRGWYGGGDKVVEGLDVALEVRVLRNRDYYEDRPGCMCSPQFFLAHERFFGDRHGG